MTYEVSQTVKIPVIGMGGITSGEDAVEFLLAGASAIMVGTWNFVNPQVCIEIINGINCYLKRYGYSSVKEIIGKIKMNR